MTEMIDSAVDNMNWGIQYLAEHPISGSDSIMHLFHDTVTTLDQFKSLQIHGHRTFHQLEKVQDELIAVKDELAAGLTDTEYMLA